VRHNIALTQKCNKFYAKIHFAFQFRMPTNLLSAFCLRIYKNAECGQRTFSAERKRIYERNICGRNKSQIEFLLFSSNFHSGAADDPLFCDPNEKEKESACAAGTDCTHAQITDQIARVRTKNSISSKALLFASGIFSIVLGHQELRGWF